MHGGPGKFAFIILGILILIDFYTFRGLRQIGLEWNSTIKIILSIIYWIVPLFISFMVFFIMKNMDQLSSGKMYYRVFYSFMGVMVLFYVPKLIFSAFLLGNDLVNGLIFLSSKLKITDGISHVQLIRNIGAGLALVFFVLTFYGIIHGRYHYKVTNHSLKFSNLPAAFSGFRVVQISDWHIGSYYGKPEKIADAVNRINALQPDIILFTGDLVNNVSTELDEFVPELIKLQAKYGKYSVLGNHDYGDYVNWKSQEARQDNLNRLKKVQNEIGFNLLNNENIAIEIEGQKIEIVGVENWGLPPFPQHGNLQMALTGSDSTAFKILMSHDPSHWDEEVKSNTDIGLTLSGHTHGMQFGFILKNLKWSPVKLKYPKWAGLYEHEDQKLYVNVGIGYIGFPGRVGMRPEITVIELLQN